MLYCTVVWNRLTQVRIMWSVLSAYNDVTYTKSDYMHFVMKWLVCLCVTELVHDDTTEVHQLKKFVCTIHQTLVHQLPWERDRKPINTITDPISLRYIILTPILSAIMDFCRSPIPSITTILSWSYTIEENEFTFKTHIVQFHTQLYYSACYPSELNIQAKYIQACSMKPPSIPT